MRCTDSDKVRQSTLAMAGIAKGVGGLNLIAPSATPVAFKKASDEHIFAMAQMQANFEVLKRQAGTSWFFYNRKIPGNLHIRHAANAEPWVTSAWMKEAILRFSKVNLLPFFSIYCSELTVT